MLIKTLTLCSLTYLVGIASAVAIHQSDPWSSAAGRGGSHQRPPPAAKGDRLPLKPIRAPVSDSAPVQPPASNAPNPWTGTACNAPIDVRGRCFARIEMTDQAA
ncbi:hypothetical protein [Bradyrhizobium stylosanthis]|uniref:hypothetical protein n=1 Tax=Bradyrhizobium stylosanthis TaxID=1803665 RepID=UPI000ABE9C88|nr:hypothetical protein [Bradyrhizobium stylosanthis]